MSARVTLSIIKGPLAGQEHAFEDRAVCIVGRASDCSPQMPNDTHHSTISRHHCLLDINPPDVRIRDFGSRNGTFLNGQKIGQRNENQTPEEGAKLQFPEKELKHGDEITLGNTTLKVAILVPEVCGQCAAEIPGRAHPPRLETAVPIPVICDDCHRKAEEERKRAEDARAQGSRAGLPPAPKPEPPNPKPVVCAQCGKALPAGAGMKRQGEELCVECMGDPGAIIRALMGEAKAGEEDLVAIRGYRIEKELGRGGMGAVYLARHEKSGKQVALKVMLPQVALTPRAKVSFLRETENTKALVHGNVVQLRDAGCSRGAFFFTLEYCDGGSVDRLMDERGGPLPVDEAVSIILQALDGLEYAHHADIPNVKFKDGTIGRGHGLVHRDIKPANILLCGSGSSRIAKVADFGLAKAFDAAGLSGHTTSGAVGGTVCFMPRQQVLSYLFSRPEVDVWAMSASLYFMLTGTPPRDFPGGEDPFRVVLQRQPVPIRERNSSIPGPLAKVIDQALIDQPEIHFKTAADLKRALEGAVR